MFTLNDYFSKVFVIHMESDKARLPHLNEQFGKNNTVYEIRPGIVPTQEDRRHYASPMCSTFCSQSMLGIYLAHRRIWEEVVSRELSSAVIFEDDVTFTQNIATVLPKAIQELPEDWDLLHLGCLSCSSSKPTLIHALTDWPKLMKPNLQPHTSHLAIPETTFGTEAYAISLRGAQKLLALLPRATNHVDYMITSVLAHLHHYSVYPQVAYQNPDGFHYTNNGSSSPLILNKVFTHVRIEPSNHFNHTTLAYTFSLPIARIGESNIIMNVWAILFLIMGLSSYSALPSLLYILIDMMYASYWYPSQIKIGQYALYIYMVFMGMLMKHFYHK